MRGRVDLAGAPLASFDERGIQLAFDAGLEALLPCLDRRHRLDTEITTMAGDGEWTLLLQESGQFSDGLVVERVDVNLVVATPAQSVTSEVGTTRGAPWTTVAGAGLPGTATRRRGQGRRCHGGYLSIDGPRTAEGGAECARRRSWRGRCRSLYASWWRGRVQWGPAVVVERRADRFGRMRRPRTYRRSSSSRASSAPDSTSRRAAARRTGSHSRTR